jgi:anaerobic ribonucleoside-triphosphate reductase activating protein
MLPFEGGTALMIEEVATLLHEAAAANNLQGITLLGGEPLAHAEASAALAREAHALALDVMVFTGYLLEEARQMPDSAVQQLLDETDILVDGPYVRELPETRRRWIGSSNQRVHFLSPRCDPEDPRWLQKNTLEIRLRDGELSVNGFPARQAVGLWKRPRRVRATDTNP